MTTIACVLAVVLGEFALLAAVFARAAPVRTQRLATSRLAGVVSAALHEPRPGRTLAHAAAAQVARLPQAGVPADQAAPVRAAVAAVQQHPGSAASWRALANRTSGLERALARGQQSLDGQTRLIFIALLALATLGWFLWFRRVIRRQRGLQEALTEQRAVVRAEKRLAAVVHAASDVILVVDRLSVVTYATPSSSVVLRIPPEHLVGGHLSALLADADAAALLDVLTNVTAGGEQRIEVGLPGDGEAGDRRLDLHVRNLAHDDAVSGLVVTVRDVTERRRFEAELSRQALQDQLTGLPNRRLFTDRLEHALTRRVGTRSHHAVLFCDLDEFKSVNDSLGHPVGDAVLSEVGQRLLASLRPSDTAARLGGDEFAILLECVTMTQAVEVANRLMRDLSQPYEIADLTLHVGVSIGVAEAAADKVSAEDALRNADLALYRAKSDGRGRVAVYEPKLHAAAVEHLTMRGELREAIFEGQLRVFWQPQVALSDGMVVGFEALVRWEHPQRGLLYPNAFLPAAHSAGLNLALDRWVLRESCRRGSELIAERPLHLSVNLSAAMLAQPMLVSEVQAALGLVNLPPELLTLEITETSLIADLAALTPKLQSLRDLGVKVAIDDFGTGFSSLAYVHQLPVDVLKIDRSFVQRLMDGPQEATVTDAIVTLGHRLELITVAEGVETVMQRDWLRDAGCYSAQGFLWSPAVDHVTARRLASRGAISERAEPTPAEPADPPAPAVPEVPQLAAVPAPR